jgi:ankyrin repeat protein
MLAAHHGYREMVETLVEGGADLNVTAKYNLSALMLAVTAGHAAVARLLARAGADLRVRGSGAPGFAGKTAHDLAVGRNMEDLYAELLPG